MRKLTFLFFVGLLLTACQSEIADNELENEVINGIRYHYSYNGTIDTTSDDSWVYTSHTKNSCRNKITSSCRKIDMNYTDYDYTGDRVVNYNFKMSLLEYYTFEPPEWIIIFQDWVKIYPDDPDGNRPISTLKIKPRDDKIFLQHYDNSWQWDAPYIIGSDFDKNPDRLNGEFEIEIGVEYEINFIIHDVGKVELWVNDNKITSVEYKTKSIASDHTIQWGLYWSKGYNLKNDPLKRIMLRIEDFPIPTKKN